MPTNFDCTRPYLVIPKLIEQPTWGGSYIADAKGWLGRPGMDRKIGQSYELFSGSNLSLLNSTDDPAFFGELTDRDAVQAQTHPTASIALTALIGRNPVAALGKTHVAERGDSLGVLAKFTQALGNSFQVHIASGTTHPRWHQKPESWYFFEPGLITLGVKPDADWDAYQYAVTAIHDGMAAIGQLINEGTLSWDKAQSNVDALVQQHDPWRYVHLVDTQAGQLIDLSVGGLHHSWEENAVRAPYGNVLYELQQDVMDDVSTLRCFDKGKIGPDGTIRDVHIADYFALIDRSPQANDPQQHIKHPVRIAQTDGYVLERLMRSPYYNLNKLSFSTSGEVFRDAIDGFRHVFVKDGMAVVSAGAQELYVAHGHSCFIPAAAATYTVASQSNDTQVLISY